MKHLPAVDFADPEHLRVLAAAVAPEGPGFFYLKMPPGAEELGKRSLQLSAELFALPLEEKLRMNNDQSAWYWVRSADKRWVTLIPSTGPGYRGLAEDANFAADMRESYNLGMPEVHERPASAAVRRSSTASPSPLLAATPPEPDPSPPPDGGTGMGANLWPDVERCSSASAAWCGAFRASAAAYFELCLETCAALRRKLAAEEVLGEFLGDAAASDSCFSRTTSLLGFTHYTYSDLQSAAVDSKPSATRFGIRPHQDDGLCTLLYTDGKPGLEYASGTSAAEGASDLSLYSGALCRDDAQLSPSITWEAVPFREGHWIVNLGTDLFRWVQQREDQRKRHRQAEAGEEGDGGGPGPAAGRRCKATLHRVVPMDAAGSDRYSMPFFYEPNLDVADRCAPFTRRWEYLVRDAGRGVVTKECLDE